MDSGNQTPVDQLKVNDSTIVTAAGSTPSNSDNLKIGDVVGERYKIVKILGHGGMGSVYKVEQIVFRQFFALKTLTGQNFPDVAIRRFQKEAQAASKLNHPNLVRAYDFGILGTHQPFFVMDLIEGENLSEYSKRMGTLSIEEILRIFIPVCFALGYAHSEGIVHRDIKPGNIMLDNSAGPNEPYIPKVVDFGIAKLTDNEGGHSVNLTRTGEIFGTPLYMSPEQCLGTKIDHRIDIYSIGCVMYEVLTGAPPFHGESALSLMMKHQSEQPQTLKEASMGREFPESLEAIVAKTMEKNPDMRYQSLLDLAQDLAVLQQGQSNLTENVTLAKTLPHLVKPQTIKAKPIPRALIAAVGIGCLAIGILVGYLLSPKPEEVVKVVDRPVESLSPREEAEKLGYVPYVKMEGRGLDAVREFRFPEAFSIGKFQTISPMAKQTTLQEAQGNHRVSVADRFFLEMSNMDLVRHPLSLRGFGETDVNSLHLLNDTKDYAGAVIYNPEITFDSALVYCSNWKAMYRFYAWGTTVSNVGMRCLQDLPNLFEVDVTDTRVTADGIRCLNAYPEKITVLGIGAMPDGRSLIPDLKSTKILTTCNFSKIDLDDDDLKVISKVKTIALLGVHENSRITDTGIVYLKELPNLVSLTTGGTSVTSASTSVLAKFSKLKYLQIDGDHWTAKEVQKLQSLMPKTMIAGAKMDARKKGVQNWDWKKEL